MPLQATSGAASYDAFGGGVAVVPTYIEDVFSTYLYTGNGTFSGETNVITNNIDLSTQGGMVWIKNRASAGTLNCVSDTVRGGTSKMISTNTTDAQGGSGSNISFQTTGFTALTSGTNTNYTGENYVSWTFRKQPKFFDIVTYTGTGVAGRTVAHSLGSTPACMIVKQTSAAGQSWAVYHRELGATKVIWLDLTNAAQTRSFTWDDTAPTSTVFTVGAGGETNSNGQTYVAYLFAHNAGGFGLTGTDNVISCGSFTTDSGGSVSVSLGYEPQWVLLKRTDSAANWLLFDVMRGFSVANENSFPSGYNRALNPNSSNAEGFSVGVAPNSTGFYANTSLTASASYIYIAIRRGPMKVPTTGTSVFNTNLETNGTNPNTLTTGFPVDLNINTVSSSSADRQVLDRLRGFSTTTATRLQTNTAVIEATLSGGFSFASNTSVIDLGWQNQAGGTFWSLGRAPSFFDQVCYTGNSVAGATQSHNLGVAPELMLIKSRTVEVNWNVYSSALSNTEYLSLNTTDAKATGTNRWNSTSPTASVFTLGTNATVNGSGEKYVAYLFATCPNVSKVGSYTGTATTKQINCGFTAGARFVLIKRTDSTGDWYVWDTARGIVAGNDPYLLLNSTAAEVTNTDYIDTYSAGFEISSTAPAAINASGGTFIFLAIA